MNIYKVAHDQGQHTTAAAVWRPASARIKDEPVDMMDALCGPPRAPPRPVNAGPLKTSASAAIPGYLVNYLYAEKLTFRKKALKTVEVANLAIFLLSSRSSGINGQGIVIDAGLGLNYFDSEIVESSMKINE